MKKELIQIREHGKENTLMSNKKKEWSKTEIASLSDLTCDEFNNMFAAMTDDCNKEILQIREQIQEDLICLLDSQFGMVEYVDEVKDMACQIIIDNFDNLTEK